MDYDQSTKLKDRLGAFIHHPVMSLIVVALILVSVGLVMAHLTLDADHPWQDPIEVIQLVITGIFVIELGTKCYVAPSRARFFAQYWIDIIAIIPWAQSLRVLRVLRLLRVFRVAMILSRRVRFVSALFRSAVGEYLVLGMIMTLLVGVGTFALYISEARAFQKRHADQVVKLDWAMNSLERRLEMQPRPRLTLKPKIRELPTRQELIHRVDAIEAKIRHRAQDGGPLRPLTEAVSDELLAEVARLRARLPRKKGADDLADVENSFWATLFFLVATEPMIGVPTTTVGRAIVLVVMFGGLTTFAIFTAIVTALMVNRLRRRMEIDDMDRFHLNQHLVVCGWNNLVPLIIEEIAENPYQEDAAVVVVADLEEVPEEITRQRGTAGVYFVRGDYTKPETLEQARIRHARTAIIVADTTIQRSDQDRDARTVLAALMIERMQPTIYTCAELLNRDNETHLRAAGIEEVVVTSEAGGHHLALAAIHAGLADVVQELMTGKIGNTILKRPAQASYVGQTILSVMEQAKREENALIIGLEVKGQDGPGSEGYQMLLNPVHTVTVGARDNLVMIAAVSTS